MPTDPTDTTADATDRPVAAALDQDKVVVRWVGPAFLLCAVGLVPWVVHLAITLPTRAEAAHYDVAWAGFDTMLLVGMGTTAGFTLARSKYLSVASSVTAGLFITDAWFDVVTASDRTSFIEALLLAAFAEIPLAVMCIWLGLHAQDLVERRMRLMMWRRRERPQNPAADLPRHTA